MSTHTLSVWLNDDEVEVEFTFSKGYPSTFDDPGCDDEVEIIKITYQQVDVTPIVSFQDMNDIEAKIYESLDC